MSYLRGFLPWITLAALSATIGWQWGALGALVVTVVVLALDRRAGVPLTGRTLEIGGGAYFAVLAVVAFVWPHSPLEAYDGALSSAWLALIAAYGLATDRPFTLEIARRTVDDETARHPMFLHVNTAITRAWAAAFAGGALLGAACVAAHQPELVQGIVQAGAFAVPMLFTRGYVARIHARRAQLIAAAV